MGEWRPDEADEMMRTIAGDRMEDQDLVLAVRVGVVVPVAAVRMDVGEVIAVHQMGEVEVVQIAEHLQAIQEADAATLHHHEGGAVLQVMEDVAAEKVALLQADDICIETIMEK